jgi:hypothetical protein
LAAPPPFAPPSSISDPCAPELPGIKKIGIAAPEGDRELRNRGRGGVRRKMRKREEKTGNCYCISILYYASSFFLRNT